MPHLCVPAHTPEYHSGAPRTSPAIGHPVVFVSLRFPLSVASSSTRVSQSASFSASSSQKLVTSPNTHITVTSSGGSCIQGRREKSVGGGGQLTPPLCLGHQGETAERKLLEHINHLDLISSEALNLREICVCGIHLSAVSAEGTATCVVWEMKVVGLLKVALKSQQSHQRTDKHRVVLSSETAPLISVPRLRRFHMLPPFFER